MVGPSEKMKKCFVVCPIGAQGSVTREHANWLLHEIIEHVFEREFPNSFVVIRADRIDEPGMIDAQIINHLLDDELVIADMSELNANAFYELGIRHMIEKPVIHMFKSGTVIPFDVKLFRAIPFSYDRPQELKEARVALANSIRAVIAEDHSIDNPVIRARGVLKLQETATPAMQLLQNEIEQLRVRLQSLEQPRSRSSWPHGADGHFPKFSSSSSMKPNIYFSENDGGKSAVCTFLRAVPSSSRDRINAAIEMGEFGDRVVGYSWQEFDLVLALHSDFRPIWLPELQEIIEEILSGRPQ